MADKLVQALPDLWKVRRLDDVAIIIDSLHKTPTYSAGSGRAMVRVTDIQGGFLDVSDALRVTENVFQEFTRRHAPKRGDIVFSRVGSYGNASYVNTDTPFCIGQNTALISPRINGRFLHLFLQSAEARRQIEKVVVGSTQKTISLKSISGLQIPVPPTEELKAIAHILGTLDDKIELNRRMNVILEAMARALFQSWFVDFDPVRAKLDGRKPAGLDPVTAALFPAHFQDSLLGHIPQGWQLGVLNDLIDTIIGGDWGSSEPSNEENVPTLCIRGADIPSLQQGSTGKMPTRFLKRTSLEKRRLLDGDLAIEISGGSPTQSTGRPVLVSDSLLHRFEHPLVCSNFCRIVKLKSSSTSKFTYLWLRQTYDNGEFFKFENGTTGIKNLAFTLFSEKHPLVIPPPELCLAFGRVVSPLLEQHQSNGIQSRTLGILREALLPKLLSGDLGVKIGERYIAKASV